jgi:hypothetical protein
MPCKEEEEEEPSPLLRFSLGRKRKWQRLHGRRRRIRMPR